MVGTSIVWQEYLRPKRLASDILPCVEDDVDRRIVAEVSRDGRMTLADLSAAVGLSVSAVQARLKRLESREVITGYRALVDADAAGRPLAAFIEITRSTPRSPTMRPNCSSTSTPSRRATRSRATPATCSSPGSHPPRTRRLVRDIRLAASVRTRTTVVLQTFYEHRPIVPLGASWRRRAAIHPAMDAAARAVA
jgi:Lrp/AsnC family leucine-responsive transcriptional regulator